MMKDGGAKETNSIKNDISNNIKPSSIFKWKDVNWTPSLMAAPEFMTIARFALGEESTGIFPPDMNKNVVACPVAILYDVNFARIGIKSMINKELISEC